MRLVVVNSRLALVDEPDVLAERPLLPSGLRAGYPDDCLVTHVEVIGAMATTFTAA